MRLGEILGLSATGPIPDLRDVIGAADGVHRFGKIEIIPLRVTRKLVEQGAYVYQSGPSRPVRIELSRYARRPHLTLMHEVGHMIDHLLLNRMRRGFGSEHDDWFGPLMETWGRDANVDLMRRALARAGARESAERRYLLRNALTPPELWARSYAQWIAVKSGNRLLEGQLQDELESEWSFAGFRLTFQWEREDFDDIIKEIDGLMRNGGLL